MEADTPKDHGLGSQTTSHILVYSLLGPKGLANGNRVLELTSLLPQRRCCAAVHTTDAME